MKHQLDLCLPLPVPALACMGKELQQPVAEEKDSQKLSQGEKPVASRGGYQRIERAAEERSNGKHGQNAAQGAGLSEKGEHAHDESGTKPPEGGGKKGKAG